MSTTKLKTSVDIYSNHSLSRLGEPLRIYTCVFNEVVKLPVENLFSNVNNNMNMIIMLIDGKQILWKPSMRIGPTIVHQYIDWILLKPLEHNEMT